MQTGAVLSGAGRTIRPISVSSLHGQVSHRPDGSNALKRIGDRPSPST